MTDVLPKQTFPPGIVSRTTVETSTRCSTLQALQILEPYGLTLVDAANVEEMLDVSSGDFISVEHCLIIFRRCRSAIAGCAEINHDKGTGQTGVGKRMIAAFGEVRTSEIKPGRIEAWLFSLKNGEGHTLASATRNQIQRYVSLVFKYGVKIGVMTGNPLNGIEKAKSRKMKAVNILQPEQAETR